MNIILGVDIGKKGGYTVMNDQKEILISGVFNFNSLEETEEFFTKIIGQYQVTMIVIGKPNRFYNIILRHAQFIGILSLIAEKNSIPPVIVNDTTARFEILGAGQGKKKEAVHEKYKGETPDVSDSMLFCEWAINHIENA